METIIGQTIDNYKIIEVLGRGGMGVVFKAIDLNLEKIVALKIIDPFLARDENFLKRFKAEGKALAKLEDRNIVNVYALRETEYGLFLVMEYVNAKNLAELIRDKGKFSFTETISIAKQLLHAIAHAHKMNIIHRDIKPNNIMICDDGTVKVMDFGIAKILQEAGSDNTVTRVAVGTLFYMSPEQIKGINTADVRNDIYAIGMTLYEMVTGRSPFEKTESEFTVQKQIVEGRIPPPSKFNPDVSKKLEKLIMKALDKDAGARFQNISEMIDALEKIEEKSPVPDKPDKHKRNTILISIIILILAGASIFIYFIMQPKQGQQLTQSNSIETAKLIINSNPAGALVFIDNEAKGTTSLELGNLKIKEYSIKLKLDGFEDWGMDNYKLTPRGGNIFASLKQHPVKSNTISKYNPTDNKDGNTFGGNAYLNLTMDIPGTIFIDGKEFDLNANQTLIEKVPAGKRSIKFACTNASKTLTIDISKNQNKSVSCYFKHQVSIISKDSTGEGFFSSVYINNKIYEKDAPTVLTLPAGNYNITVKRKGYHVVEGTTSLVIKPEFEPKTYPLVFILKKDL